MNVIEHSIDALPAFPATSMKLIDLLNQEDPTIDEIVQVIKYDQSLTVQILKISNSAYFGMIEPVKTIDEALMTVGTSRLLQIVMAYQIGGIFEDFNKKFHKAYRVTSEVIWQSSVRLAVASTLVGNYLENYDTGNLFISGLLHNIGKVVIADVYSDEFDEIHKLVAEESVSYADAEKQILGINYQDVSAMLVAKWGLGENVANNILHYNNRKFLGDPDSQMDVLFIAYLISDFAEEDANWIIHSNVLEAYDIGINDLSRLQSTLNGEMNKIVTMLKV